MKHHMIKNKFLLMLLVLLPLLAQCTFLKQIVGIRPRKPEVQLQKIQLVKASPEALDLDVKMRITNPNDFNLRFSDLEYELFVEEKKLAEGIYKEEFTLNSNSTVTLEIPVRVHTLQVLSTLARFFREKQLQAKWVAKANFVSPLGKIAVNFDGEETIR